MKDAVIGRPEFYERGSVVKWYVVRWFCIVGMKTRSLRTKDKQLALSFYESKKGEGR